MRVERRQTASVTMALLAAALVLPACSNESPTAPTPPSSVTVVVSQNQNIGTGTNPVASPSPGACTISSVGNSLHGTSDQGGIRSANLRVNEQRTLDTTPKGPTGGLIPDTCPLAAVSWSNTNPASCRLNSSSVYTPVVTALAPGNCELRATVGSVTASEPIVISVLPAGS